MQPTDQRHSALRRYSPPRKRSLRQMLAEQPPSEMPRPSLKRKKYSAAEEEAKQAGPLNVEMRDSSE